MRSREKVALSRVSYAVTGYEILDKTAAFVVELLTLFGKRVLRTFETHL